ncbi:ParB/RepB/Spo0J family partition protein [Enteractinococcus coprophilus]|uniref:ParB family chromosome partitioning protein n=1 Tax=Enteractinococcus coprophilus TaxID=1027633 RepID=A0A543ANQ7_9MICC|nr:ParB/RepB/Spo0J family partition protein [Enteractinococcus coprophilus]TQL74211.1 ParB family chromosome partitioning protein [Enteractinococcus coprophilus]
MTQQPNKNRRGLGRGLGALIQDTSVTDEESAEEVADKTPTTTSGDTSVAATAPTKDQSSKNVGSRYLDSMKPAREKRRPADLFFGDDPSPSRQPARNKANRASMPNPILERPTLPAFDEPSVAEPESHDESLLREIALDDVQPNPRQPREEFDEEAMGELVASITEVGVLQPVVVRPTSTEGQYELIMGERRWRASRRAGKKTIPAIVRDTADEDLLREALLENIHRSELNALEEAAAYQQLMQDFGWSQDVLAKRVGRSRPHISNTLRLMNLPPAIQRQVAAGVLSAGHARAILGVSDQAVMIQLAQRVINEGLSVRSTEELANLMAKNSEDASKVPTSARRNARQFDELASSLTDLLDTSVKITLGAKKGRIAIDFASVDDLNRIMKVISPEDPA